MQHIKYYKWIFFIFACMFCKAILAKKPPNSKFIVKISRAEKPIKIDGQLDFDEWKSADIAKDFWEKNPDVKPNAFPNSEVNLLYDDKYLYVGITCYDTLDKIIQSLKPDKEYWNGDGFCIVLDPMNKKTNGFLFGINPLGTQSEALITNTENMLNFDWNNKWQGKSKIYPDKWTAELAIPFSTLRFDPNNLEWGVNFIRNAININQYHTWTEVPLQYYGINLGYYGTLLWDEIPATKKRNITLIPYVSGLLSNDFEESTTKNDLSTGLDAKVSITKSLNLDLTVNPDFSQIEIDEQRTNLTRFSVFLPEKRTFFLENSDLFGSFGLNPIRPFSSRTIGLDEDGNTVPIKYGLRITGNVSDNSRIGLLNVMSSTADSEKKIKNNYTAASYTRSILKRSTIKFLFTNRQKIQGKNIDNNDYGRNFGGEFNFKSESGDYAAWISAFNSLKPEKYEDNIFYSLGFDISKTNFGFLQAFSGVGSGFYADMGIISRIERYDAINDEYNRIGYHQSYSIASYKHFPKNQTKIYQQDIKLINFSVYNFDYSYNDRSTSLEYRIEFANSSSLKTILSDNQPKPLYPFYFTEDEDKEALPAQIYHYNDVLIEYKSDARKNFSYSSNIQYGGFYNGTKLSINGGVSYRWQPRISIGLNAEHNDLLFPEKYGNAKINVVSSKIEFNFNKNLFWTTFLQYIDQSDQFNVNSRLQWRFAPFSDLFLVYTDNYASEGLFIGKAAHKSQALVLKLNYWWNI